MNWIFAVLVVVSMTACSTTGFVTSTMSNKDYMAMTPEARASYLAAVDEEHQVIMAKTAVEYATGRPVFIGDDKTGYTVQWDRRAGLMHVYPGHKPDGMGVESYTAMTFHTDKSGVPILNKDGTMARPVYVNAANQKNLTRAIIETVATIGPAAFNGAVAAGITSSVQRDCLRSGGCGGQSNPTVIYNEGAQALSLSKSGAKAAVNVSGGGTCTTGPCLAR